MNRRSFLLTGGSAFLASAAQADTVSIGVIGAGSRGTWVMTIFQKSPNVRVAAICDVYTPNLEHGVSTAAKVQGSVPKAYRKSLLMAALGQKRKVFLCVQNLTCPGASLVHSVALAAHVPAVRAIEANARQYVPAANRGWEKRFPGIFIVKSGTLNTTGIDGPGLGAVPPLERTNS